jgi:hypothetical protein
VGATPSTKSSMRTGVQRRHSMDTIELALNVLAIEGGRTQRAHEILAGQGIDVPKQTLSSWKLDSHADRYHQISTDVSLHRAERIANQAEEVALLAGQLERDLLKDLQAHRADLKPAEIAGAIRNVTTTKALNMDKVINPIRGRPSTITETRDANTLLESLAARLPPTIQGTAQEVNPPHSAPTRRSTT